MEVDPNTGLAPDAGTPVLFVPSQRSFRQNITDDERDSVFLAAQWQPSDRLDLNVDYQSSDRVFAETRNDLVFAEQRRVNPEGLVVSASGIIQAFNNNGRVETLSTAQERLEEYRGGGFAASYQVNDRLELSLDVSNSSTSRRENIIHTRLQSEPRDIHGNPVPAGTDRPDANYVLSGGASEVAAITVTNFDVTNHDLFADNARTRVDLNQARENDITAVRADFHLLMDGAMIYSLEGGVRSSALDFQSWPRVRLQESHSDSAIPGASMACRNDVFPEDDFLSEPANGQPLITNVDENGNVIAQGTGNTFATFDPLCLARELFGGEIPAIPAPRQTVGNVDVEERTLAAYVQANYRTEFAGKPVRGNFGLRVVRTDVDSTGLRTTFTSSRDDDGTLTINEDSSDFYSVVGGDSYTELLPSFNAVLDMNDDVLLRVGVFRGLSRPDPADMGFGRVLSVDDEDATSISEVVGQSDGQRQSRSRTAHLLEPGRRRRVVSERRQYLGAWHLLQELPRRLREHAARRAVSHRLRAVQRGRHHISNYRRRLHSVRLRNDRRPRLHLSARIFERSWRQALLQLGRCGFRIRGSDVRRLSGGGRIRQRSIRAGCV